MKAISRVEGIVSSLAVLLLTVSALALTVGVAGYVLAEDHIERSASARIIEVALGSIAALLPIFILCKKSFIAELVDAFTVVSIFWVLAPLLSAILYSRATEMPFIDAFFESMSGFSGTGLSVLDKPEALPRVVLAWRALTQWVGELGVVVISGVLLPFLHRSIRSIYVVERGAKIAPTVVSTTRRLFTIYSLYTLAGVLLFLASGMDILDSVLHSMTAIATGGMSTHSQNLGYWFEAGNRLVAVSAAIVMTLGALNFMDLYNLTRGRLRDFAESIEVRGFAAILSTFLVALGAISIATSSVESFWVWSFHVLSGFTTTGFSLAPISEHPDVVKVVIILSMVIGGATFSTAGGIKIKRAIVTAKLVFWETSKTFIPKSVVVVRKVGGEVIRDEDVSSIYSFVALYGLTLVATSIALHLSLLTSGIASYSYVDSLLETSSALSCVGLSSGIASSSAPALTKAILMIAMYLGRIEFLPLYTIIGAYYMSKITL